MDLAEFLTDGNVAEVKVVLASVVAALAVYQVVLMTVGWGKVRVRFLSALSAAQAHRAIGDTLVVVTVVVAALCVSYFEVEHARIAHVVVAIALLVVLAVKVAVVRSGRGSRALPYLGTAVLALFLATWATSAGGFLT